MSIEDSQNLFFCNISSHSFSERSGPGPLGPVRKSLVVWSGPEGPQFARSVGTLMPWQVLQGNLQITFQVADETGKSHRNIFITYVICITYRQIVHEYSDFFMCPSFWEYFQHVTPSYHLHTFIFLHKFRTLFS